MSFHNSISIHKDDVVFFLFGDYYSVPKEIIKEIIFDMRPLYATCDERNRFVAIFSFINYKNQFSIKPLKIEASDILIKIESQNHHRYNDNFKSDLIGLDDFVQMVSDYIEVNKISKIEDQKNPTPINKMSKMKDFEKFKRFLGKSSNFYCESPEGYNLSSDTNEENEEEWLKSGFSEKSQNWNYREFNDFECNGYADEDFDCDEKMLLENSYSNEERQKFNQRIKERIFSDYEKVRENPNDSEIWYMLGNRLRILSLNDEALLAYDKVLSINPDNPIVWDKKTEILFKLGKYNEARECQKRAKELRLKIANSYSNK